MSTSSEKPISHGHGLAGQDLHATESDNANATVGWHRAENDYDLVQTAYVPKKEAAQPTLEDNFAHAEAAIHPTSEAESDSVDRCVINVNADGTAEQRLWAALGRFEREEAAARLPKAAQLASVPNLAPIGDGIWPPHSLEPDYLARRDTLRGPRTMIKMSVLIVGILSVPMAYYFWMGGWDTIPGASPPELASFNSKPIIPPPKSSSEEETGAQRDAQTPIPAPRPTAALSPTATTDRTAVEAQTPPPAVANPTATTDRTAVAPMSGQNVTPSDQSNVDEIVVLLKRGQDLLRHGDLAAARLVLRHAAEAKNAEAALTLGSTYDPVTLRELRVYGFSADVGMARTWYEKAKELGSPEAARRLDNLGR